jgi:hypothetical protein
MFDWLRQKLRPRAKSPGEYAEDEAARRRAQKLNKAERRMAEEQQRLDSATPRGGGGFGGWN